MTPQNSVRLACLFTALCMGALGGACSDGTSSAGGDAGGWIDTAGDDDDVDVGEPDADASEADTPRDGGDVEIDPVDVTTTRGWYLSSFETSLFVPDPTLLSADWSSDDPQGSCRLPLWQNAEAAGVERWWANGISASETLDIFPPMTHDNRAPQLGLIEATGEVSELGQHGHLGGYDREFEVTSSQLDICGSFERLGHCVVPPPGAWCTAHDARSGEFDNTHLARTIPGVQPAEPTLFYDLRVSSDTSSELSALVLSIAVPGDDQSADDGQFPTYTTGELYDVSLRREESQSPTSTDTTYQDLTGWVALDTISLRESIYVSISGTDADGNEAAIWGHFVVDETLALP